MIDVIIPARNEQDTIENVVTAFYMNQHIGVIVVVVDADTADMTGSRALRSGAVVVSGPPGGGKGQNIKAALPYITTERVILCDADVRMISPKHVHALLDGSGLIIGVPDMPKNLPDGRRWSWPWVSGERALPTSILRETNLHGYLTEVQINMACEKAGIRARLVPLPGLKSAYRMTDQRLAEMERDRLWGVEHGVFS